MGTQLEDNKIRHDLSKFERPVIRRIGGQGVNHARRANSGNSFGGRITFPGAATTVKVVIVAWRALFGDNLA